MRNSLIWAAGPPWRFPASSLWWGWRSRRTRAPQASTRGDRRRGGSWVPFGDRERSPRPRLEQWSSAAVHPGEAGPVGRAIFCTKLLIGSFFFASHVQHFCLTLTWPHRAFRGEPRRVACRLSGVANIPFASYYSVTGWADSLQVWCAIRDS